MQMGKGEALRGAGNDDGRILYVRLDAAAGQGKARERKEVKSVREERDSKGIERGKRKGKRQRGQGISEMKERAGNGTLSDTLPGSSAREEGEQESRSSSGHLKRQRTTVASSQLQKLHDSNKAADKSRHEHALPMRMPNWTRALCCFSTCDRQAVQQQERGRATLFCAG